ncbi:MAG: (4Fe-4S)-binding protein [Bifidobacteriaceae bacterium]|jgi:uncharacterized Fe-S cluster protein YjdI|nr:(4Fe-4S)-binding protein [Bifidobacteriaceae bacterium]
MARKNYTGKDITVSFDLDVCQHAAICVHTLPAVFNTKRRPWILADAAPAEEVATVVSRCPSGALRYELVQH